MDDWLNLAFDLISCKMTGNLSLYHNCDSTASLRYDYDTTTTKNWQVHFFARVEWKQARAIGRSRIVVESQIIVITALSI